MTREIKNRIKESLKAVEKASDKEPLILIDNKGSYWLNDHAKEFFGRRNVPIRAFMEWVTIGSLHLQNLSYEDIDIHMMRLPENIVVFLREGAPHRSNEKFALTAREKQVLHHIVKGFTNKEIARVMKISPGTVNSHLDKIYRKLGCTNRVAAAFLSLKKGLFLSSYRSPSTATAH